MDRRAFLTVAVGSILAAPLAVDAQDKTPRIGYLSNGTPTSAVPQVEAFRRGLRELGWIERQSIVIEYRWAEGNLNRVPALLAELVQLKVDVIVLAGSTAVQAAAKMPSTIPVVFVSLADPVTLGVVPSLARPGGEMTGLASEFEELITKQLQLLTEALPNVSRIALLHHPDISSAILTAAETAARRLGLTVSTLSVSEVAEYESAFKRARAERAGAIHVLPSPYFNAHRLRLIELAAWHRLPAFYEFSNYVQEGGLISYGPSIDDMFRRMASYVDRILKGAKPGDLPIERPTKFELVINLKTAKALGLTIPPSVLARADQVIE
jgi:putative tryptophan/tyrosine transport system substrate-binding protein